MQFYIPPSNRRSEACLLSATKKHLRREGIPFLALDGDWIDGNSFPWGQARTRADNFYELIQQ